MSVLQPFHSAGDAKIAANRKAGAEPKSPDGVCIRCRFAKVDRRKSKTLCLWCRLGDLVHPTDRAAALGVPLEVPDPELDAMAEEYEDGATCSEIGIAHGVSEETVRRRLVAGGVVMRRDSGTWSAEVVHNNAGERLCPECNVHVIRKKNPHGPGRYPARCEECKARRAA